MDKKSHCRLRSNGFLNFLIYVYVEAKVKTCLKYWFSYCFTDFSLFSLREMLMISVCLARKKKVVPQHSCRKMVAWALKKDYLFLKKLGASPNSLVNSWVKWLGLPYPTA